MILKTIQPFSILKSLNNPATKEIFAQPFHKHEGYWGMFESYEWMKSQMPTTHKDTDTLFWAWEYESENNKILADEILQSDSLSGGVVLTLDKPINQLLLSDVNNWLYGLNYFYLPGNRRDYLKHENLIKNNSDLDYFENKPLKNEEMNKNLTDSWKKIFNIRKNKNSGNYEYNTPKSFLKHMEIDKTDVLIQACFWSFTPKEILDVKTYS